MSLRFDSRNMAKQTTLMGFVQGMKPKGYMDFVFDPVSQTATFENKSKEDGFSLVTVRDGIRLWSSDRPIDHLISRPSTGQMTLPFAKSALQKAIRRGDSHSALSLTNLMVAHWPLELLRRLAVIAVEDVEPVVGYETIVWLMMASKEYPLRRREQIFIREYVVKLCKHLGIFVYRTRNPAPKRHTLAATVDPDKRNRALAIYHRARYGGMDGDVKMLYEASRHYTRYPLGELSLGGPCSLPRDAAVHPRTDVGCDPGKYDHSATIKDCTHFWDGIDFHGFPRMTKEAAAACGCGQEEMKNYIWTGYSALNVRKPLTIKRADELRMRKDWSIISEAINGAKQNIWRRMLTTAE
jgi:hypothetical protein